MNINIENYKIFRVCRTLLRIFQINVYPYSCEDYFYLRLQRVWQYTRDVMFQLTHNDHGRTDVTIIISTLREIYIIASSIAWIFELYIFLRNSHRTCVKNFRSWYKRILFKIMTFSRSRNNYHKFLLKNSHFHWLKLIPNSAPEWYDIIPWNQSAGRLWKLALWSLIREYTVWRAPMLE